MGLDAKEPGAQTSQRPGATNMSCGIVDLIVQTTNLSTSSKCFGVVVGIGKTDTLDALVEDMQELKRCSYILNPLYTVVCAQTCHTCNIPLSNSTNLANIYFCSGSQKKDSFVARWFPRLGRQISAGLSV